MNPSAKRQLREFIEKALANQGDRAGFGDDEALFSSGRLDSFTMMNLVMYLEQNCGIDFAGMEFDIELVDSIDTIESLVDTHGPA